MAGGSLQLMQCRVQQGGYGVGHIIEMIPLILLAVGIVLASAVWHGKTCGGYLLRELRQVLDRPHTDEPNVETSTGRAVIC